MINAEMLAEKTGWSATEYGELSNGQMRDREDQGSEFYGISDDTKKQEFKERQIKSILAEIRFIKENYDLDNLIENDYPLQALADQIQRYYIKLEDGDWEY